MRRAKLNYVVDAIVAVACAVAAVSGMVFLLPESLVGVSGSGQATVLGVGLPTWNLLHQWGGMIMVIGVLGHTLLHARWIVTMTGRLFGGKREATVAAAEPARPPAAETPSPTSPAARSDARVTRRGFLVGAAGVGVVALAGGLVSRELIGGGSGLSVVSAASSSEESPASADASKPADTGDSRWSDENGSSGSSSTGATTADRVVVDQNACNGCGDCLPSCPASVFAFSGGRAYAAAPDACRLCGHCLRACPTGAITINA